MRRGWERVTHLRESFSLQFLRIDHNCPVCNSIAQRQVVVVLLVWRVQFGGGVEVYSPQREFSLQFLRIDHNCPVCNSITQRQVVAMLLLQQYTLCASASPGAHSDGRRLRKVLETASSVVCTPFGIWFQIGARRGALPRSASPR